MTEQKRKQIFRIEAIRHYLERLSNVFPLFFVSSPVRVPYKQQLSSVECGAASLAMVLSYFGRETSVAECRKHMDIGRDGASAYSILSTASFFGLRGKAYSVHDLNNFRYIRLPAIAHWDFAHFVVIEKWTEKKVTIMDPAVGRREISIKEFSDSFTGVILVFETGNDFIPRSNRKNKAIIQRYMEVFSEIPNSRKKFIPLLVSSILIQLVGLILPLATQQFIDRVIPSHSLSFLNSIGIGCLLVLFTLYVIRLVRDRLLNSMQAQIDYQIMSNFMEHLLSLPLPYFMQRSTGDLLLRLNSSVFLREIITVQSFSFLIDGSLSIVYFSILFIYSPNLGILAALLGLAQLAVYIFTQKKNRQNVQQHLVAQAEEQSYLTEALSSMILLKSSGSEEVTQNHWQNLFTEQLNCSLTKNKLSASIETFLHTIRLLSPIVLVWAGVYQVILGKLSLGTMFGLNSLALSAIAPISGLVGFLQYFTTASSHLERLFDITDTSSEQSSQQTENSHRLLGTINTRNVSFRYNANSKLVLNDININIEKGQTVAIVGPTGSGKSTFLNILLGLYPLTSGKITYDGIDLETQQYQLIRKQIGIVLQDTFLFSGSIRQNIQFYNPIASFDELEYVTKMAVLDQEIESFPLGYETLVSEGGGSLSGGQRQRIAIARALLRIPKILFLDEATSHLDSITEKQVIDNLKTLTCTKIIVAHRLSTIKHADTIFVLNQGILIEKGSHNELLSNRGFYYRLIEQQTDTEK